MTLEGQTVEQLQYLVNTEPDSAIKALLTANELEISEKKKCHLLAVAFQNRGDFDQSQLAARKCLSFPVQDSSDYYDIQIIIAENYRLNKEYDSSLYLLYRIKNFHESLRDTNSMVKDLIRLLEFERTIEDLDRALEYGNQAQKLIDIWNQVDKGTQAGLYNRKAAIFTQRGYPLDSAIYLSKLAINIAEDIGDKALQASSANELGFLFMNLGMDSSLYYFKMAKDLYRELDNLRYLSSVMSNTVRLYLQRNDYHSAMNEINDILELPGVENYEIILRDCYDDKANILYRWGRFREAFDYQKKARDYELKTEVKRLTKELTAIKSKYELEEAQRIIKTQQKEVEEATTRARLKELEKNQLYYFLFVAFVLLGVVAFFLVRISRKNQALKTSSLLLEKSNSEQAKLLKQKETLLQEINHRVKNNLSVLSSMLYLQKKSLHNKEAIQALSLSQNRIATIALVHESLYSGADPNEVDFQSYLEKLCLTIKDSFGDSAINVKFDINVRGLKLDLERSISMAMILNEILTNSFKHAFSHTKEPLIGIKWQAPNTLRIFDNGGGKVEYFKESVGLKLINIFAEQLNADVFTTNENELLVTIIKFNATE